MKKVISTFLTILFFLALAGYMQAQTITIGTGARITVAGGTNKGTALDCDGSIIMNGNLTLTGDAFLFLGGDFVRNNNGFARGNSTVVFNGSAPQAITRTVIAAKFSETFYRITIDNPSGVSLDNTQISTLTIVDLLTPSQGTLITNDVLILRDTPGSTYSRVAAGNGTISGNVLVEKEFDGFVSTVLGWRQFSRPVSGPSNAANWSGITLLYNTYVPAARINTFRYNSTASGNADYAYSWQAAAPTSPTTEALSIFLENNGFHNFSPTISVSGVLNQGDFLNNLNFTRDTADDPITNDDAKGWNFIPNPWPALVNTQSLLNDAVNFTSGYKAIHVWDATYQFTNEDGDEEVGQYRAILGNGVKQNYINYDTPGDTLDYRHQNIPPFQAFWVKATAGGQVCNLIASTMQSTVVKGQALMKQEYPIVRLNVFDADSAHEQLVIYFDESTTRNFDLVGDAYYLPSMRKDAPRFYALEGNSKACIVGRPAEVTDSVQVVFGSPKNQSKFYIHADLDELPEGWFVYLRDKKDNKTYALAHNQSLAFNHFGGLNSNRFVVYYSKQAHAFAHLVSGAEARILPFVRNQQLVVQNVGMAGDAQINAFDAVGRLIYSTVATLEPGQERILDLAPTQKLLFIEVSINGKSFVEKVYF